MEKQLEPKPPGCLRESRGFLMTLDPLHIGTGAYRLSRVDLPILRDPATDLPKIPGTALNGAARSYAALIRSAGNGPVKCAGQRDHCGTCEICMTFGAIRPKPTKTNADGRDNKSDGGIARSGMVSFFDAPLVLFPVRTMRGPVWITSPAALAAIGVQCPVTPGDSEALFSGVNEAGQLNFGWILLPTKPLNGSIRPLDGFDAETQASLATRLAVLPDSVFSHIVNSNLEVRTSVSIDPATGAAKTGALFTYEAVPRAAFFHLTLIENRFHPEWPKDPIWETPLEVAWAGLSLTDRLGIGGMGTRGFGRLKLFRNGKGKDEC